MDCCLVSAAGELVGQVAVMVGTYLDLVGNYLFAEVAVVSADLVVDEDYFLLIFFSFGYEDGFFKFKFCF